MGISSAINFRSFAPMKGLGAQDDRGYRFVCNQWCRSIATEKPRT
jgi:hypothetical protein